MTGQDKKPGGIDVAYVARLARLALTEEETESFQRQLEKVEQHFREISGADVSGIGSAAHRAEAGNVLREDIPKPGLERDKALENAPMHDGEQMLAPAIIA